MIGRSTMQNREQLFERIHRPGWIYHGTMQVGVQVHPVALESTGSEHCSH